MGKEEEYLGRKGGMKWVCRGKKGELVLDEEKGVEVEGSGKKSLLD